MKILIIGGTGNISWYCTRKAIDAGHEVHILNRGKTTMTRRQAPSEAHQHHVNMRFPALVKRALNGMKFDIIADFICYNQKQAETDIKLFQDITKHFFFISSTAVYQRPWAQPITEDTPVSCPLWTYAQDKIWAEKEFRKHNGRSGFPVTILRPGHTYDTLIPEPIGNGDWKIAQCMLDHKPVFVPGDGTNLWTVTHSEDFADAFVRLLDKEPREIYNVVGDERLTWNDIVFDIADALGVQPKIVYIPEDMIQDDTFKYHKRYPDIYDNTKIKNTGWKQKILFKEGIRKTIAWLKEDKRRQRLH